MHDIKVVLTMDCEPTLATSHPRATGPVDWRAGEDAVLGYVSIAAQYGLPVTLFVHPEAAVAQSALFQELEARGACLGLHMHPWKSHFGATKGASSLHTMVDCRHSNRARSLRTPRPCGQAQSAIVLTISAPVHFQQTMRSFRCSLRKVSEAALAALRGG